MSNFKDFLINFYVTNSRIINSVMVVIFGIIVVYFLFGLIHILSSATIIIILLLLISMLLHKRPFTFGGLREEVMFLYNKLFN